MIKTSIWELSLFRTPKIIFQNSHEDKSGKLQHPILHKVSEQANFKSSNAVTRVARTRWVKLDENRSRVLSTVVTYVTYTSPIDLAFSFVSSWCSLLEHGRYVKSESKGLILHSSALVATPFIRETGEEEAGERSPCKWCISEILPLRISGDAGYTNISKELWQFHCRPFSFSSSWSIHTRFITSIKSCTK